MHAYYISEELVPSGGYWHQDPVSFPEEPVNFPGMQWD